MAEHVSGESAANDATANSDLDARKAVILRTVVQEHIVTGQPVGSGHLSAASGLAVSSATIRNEMQALEREGYLTHPHTSAGRIPTDRGYRYFVDSIGDGTRLAEPKSAQVRTFFDRAQADIEELMADASRLLTNLTDYAAVVVAPSTETITIRSAQIIDLGSTALVVVVLSNGVVEKVTLTLDAGGSEATVNAASARLAALLVGETLGGLREEVVLPSGEARVDALCRSAVNALCAHYRSHDEGSEVFLGGASRMVGAFDTVSTIRQVLATLEEQYVVVNLIREALDRPAITGGVAGSVGAIEPTRLARVSIGTEHGNEAAFEALLSCSIVVAPYLVDGRPVGTVGVLGPTRMDYPNAMAAVTAVSDGLTEQLSD